MIVLAFDLFWVSQMSIQTMDMSDLGETLITLSFNAKTMSLKIWLAFKVFLISLDVKQALVILDK